MLGETVQYKGVSMGEKELYKFYDDMLTKQKLTEIIFSLKFDEKYSKDDAVKDLLDVITETLDFGFLTVNDEEYLEKVKKINLLKGELQKIQNEMKAARLHHK